MEIRIHIPRPLLSLSVLVVIGLWLAGIVSFHLPWLRGGTGGTGGTTASLLVAGAVQQVDTQRVRQAVLAHEEEILRFQLQALEDQALHGETPESIRAVREARETLLSIIRQRTASEKLLAASLAEIWEAEGTAYTLGNPAASVLTLWPVQPALGISAAFEDAAYQERFGFPHHAIDIPTEQGTAIRAPADGTVKKVAMNGMGYSYIILDHGNGEETIYGHVNRADVTEGSIIHAGDVIGASGGQPGTPGAGLLTTGPHLHFAMKVGGVLVDPMKYLPQTRKGEG